VEDGDRWGRIKTDSLSGCQRGKWAGNVHLWNLFSSLMASTGGFAIINANHNTQQ
jgi:hypothetical protein